MGNKKLWVPSREEIGKAMQELKSRTDADKQRRIVGSLSQLLSEGNPFSAQDIASLAKVARSTVCAILSAWRTQGWKVEDNGPRWLGPTVFEEFRQGLTEGRWESAKEMQEWLLQAPRNIRLKLPTIYSHCRDMGYSFRKIKRDKLKPVETMVKSPWSEAQIKELEDAEPTDKVRAVLEIAKNTKSLRQVSNALGLSKSIVHRWTARFRDQGINGLKSRSKSATIAESYGAWEPFRCACNSGKVNSFNDAVQFFRDFGGAVSKISRSTAFYYWQNRKYSQPFKMRYMIGRRTKP